MARLRERVIAALLAALFLPATAWAHDGDHEVVAVLIGGIEAQGIQCKLMLSAPAVGLLVNRDTQQPRPTRWDPQIVKQDAVEAFIRDCLVVRIDGHDAVPGQISTRFAGLAEGELPDAESEWSLIVTYGYPLTRPPTRVDFVFADASRLAGTAAEGDQTPEADEEADAEDQASAIALLVRAGNANSKFLLTEHKPTYTWPASAQPVATSTPLPDDWHLNAGVFRGSDGSACTRFKGVPTQWDEKEQKNFLWRTRLPLGGLASPLAYGDKVLVAGASRARRELYCVSAKDGALLWTGTYESSPEASTEYPVFDDLAPLMHAAATPATDGKTAYAIFANGELAAFDLASGRNLWSRVIGTTDKNAYGLSGSLLIYKGSVIVQFDGGENLLARYDRTGKEIWKTGRDDFTWSSPILIVTADGGCQIVTNGDPETCGWDPETGKRLWNVEAVSGELAPSPIYAGGLVWTCFKGCGIFGIDPLSGKIKHEIIELEHGEISDTNSLCTDGAFVYQFVDEMVTCIDAASGKVVYEKEVACYASYASPFVNDGNLYLGGNRQWLIASAGPEFKVVGQGRIEEHSDTSPAVVPGRIYIRTATGLCAIGAR